MDATRLTEVLARHARDGLTPTALPDVSVMLARRTTEPLGDMVEPTVAVIAQGVKETAVNGRAHTYGPGQVFIATVDLPVVGRIVRASDDEPFLAAVLRLRPERIAALLLDTAPPHDRVPATPSGIAVTDASPALLDAVVRLVGLLDAPDDAAALADGVEREVLWRLLTGPQGAVVRQIGSADSRLTHLTRAIRRIRDHYAEVLRVEDLAALASMSPSSFHRHFRAVTSMTPIQYQKSIRLHEARARLLASPGDVAGVGYSVGYDSPSQFSREYRRAFGVPPSRHQATGSS
ncbi:AraC family transcriptional regulator N-terminal domain-containing protein [Umezawaea sp. NPDC059074]|uniref:AraC family transcriptional regulator n=1 Tax=Umezawaea sp. NPDC059074 TaxID=3346716 RepID=UPI0036B491C2